MKRLFSIIGVLVLVAFGVWTSTWLSSHMPAVQGEPEKPPPPKPPFATENPFLPLPKEGPQPAAAAPEQSFDFGRAIAETKGQHRFVVKNDGKAPLKLANAGSSCPACTILELESKELAPGAETGIVVEWHPQGQHPKFSKYVKVWTNDPAHEQLTFTVEGEIVSAVWVDPPTINIEAFSSDEPKPFTINVVTGLTKDLTVTARPSSDLITTEIIPIPAEELAEFKQRIEVDPLAGFYIKGMLRPKTSVVGPFNESLTVVTNVPGAAEVKVDLNSGRSGPIRVMGPLGWQGGRSLMDLGRFSSKQGKSAKLSLFTDKLAEGLKISGVTGTETPMQFEIEKDDTYSSEKKERYWLTIRFPAGGQHSRFSMQVPAELKLHLNHPAAPELILNLMYDAD